MPPKNDKLPMPASSDPDNVELIRRKIASTWHSINLKTVWPVGEVHEGDSETIFPTFNSSKCPQTNLDGQRRHP